MVPVAGWSIRYRENSVQTDTPRDGLPAEDLHGDLDALPHDHPQALEMLEEEGYDRFLDPTAPVEA